MNIEPPPEAEKIEKLMPSSLRRWGQGRLLEAEEEDYFNTDDDVEDVPVLGQQLQKGSPPKRRRLRGMGLPGRVPRNQHQSMPLQSLGALVAYDDGEDVGGLGALEDEPAAPASPSSPRSPSGGFFAGASSEDVPSSPRISHKQIASKSSSPSDDQDDLLEQLFKSGPSSPSNGKAPDIVGAKRRRDDEDDELLERLASRSKRPSVGPNPEKENTDHAMVSKAGPAKSTDEGPKKIKLKFGAVGAAVASSTSPSAPTAPSDPGSKEGDNG